MRRRSSTASARAATRRSRAATTPLSAQPGMSEMDPILTRYVREPNGATLDFYLQHGKYEALRKALAMTPGQVIEMVQASGLRGRGGAGFPTGMKWQFVDQKFGKPRYLAR